MALNLAIFEFKPYFFQLFQKPRSIWARKVKRPRRSTNFSCHSRCSKILKELTKLSNFPIVERRRRTSKNLRHGRKIRKHQRNHIRCLSKGARDGRRLRVVAYIRNSFAAWMQLERIHVFKQRSPPTDCPLRPGRNLPLRRYFFIDIHEIFITRNFHCVVQLRKRSVRPIREVSRQFEIVRRQVPVGPISRSSETQLIDGEVQINRHDHHPQRLDLPSSSARIPLSRLGIHFARCARENHLVHRSQSG